MSIKCIATATALKGNAVVKWPLRSYPFLGLSEINEKLKKYK
jgi:hypothetical protein